MLIKKLRQKCREYGFLGLIRRICIILYGFCWDLCHKKLCKKIEQRLKIKHVVFQNNMVQNIAIQKKIAIHLHLYYTDMIDWIASYLNNFQVPFDLYISTIALESEHSVIQQRFKEKVSFLNQCIVKTVPNRGRDIAPLICTFGNDLLQYDIIAHIHTKKSSQEWCTWCYDHLLGSKELIQYFLEQLSNNTAIIYPQNYKDWQLLKISWENNLKNSQKILDLAKISINLKKEFPIIFFSQGTMFVAKVQNMKKLLTLPLTYDDFPKEPIPLDGTLAHALERTLLLWDLDSSDQNIVIKS